MNNFYLLNPCKILDILLLMRTITWFPPRSFVAAAPAQELGQVSVASVRRPVRRRHPIFVLGVDVSPIIPETADLSAGLCNLWKPDLPGLPMLTQGA
jgi:hypothetical protein